MAPALGFALKGRRQWQLRVFGLMCFMTLNGLLGPGNWGLTLASIENYRGHTKGYHFFFNHALAIALIVARRLEDGKSFWWIPPGIGLFLIYCGISMISIPGAPDPSLGWMAAHKTIFASVLMVATFNTLRSGDDFKFFLKVMNWTMLWELFVCLKMKYLQHMYQVHGTFEHQNPLAMYSVMIGLVFLAVGLGPKYPGANFNLFCFGACALIVQCTLSRGALVMFGAGAVVVVAMSLGEKLTSRRLLCTATLGLVGAAGLMLVLDRIIARFHDQGNQASGELREVMKDASRAMVEDYHMGIGWNNFALVINRPYKYAEIYYDWDRRRGMKPNYELANGVVESHYYLLLAENGKPGLYAWLVVICMGLWRNARAFFFFPHSFERCLTLGIGAGCAFNYVQSTIERVLVQPRNLMLWLILLGITARLEITRREEKRKAREEKRMRREEAVA